MPRDVAGKAMRVVKGVALFGGVTVTLALVLGVASVALAANGQPFLLGRATNAATALTKLTGNVDGAAMQVQNTNAEADDTALNLNVQPGEAPMRVNSDAKVTNLNADELDGLNASQIGRQYWAAVDADGNLSGGRGVASSERTATTGGYVVTFTSEVDDCAYTATLAGFWPGQASVVGGAGHEVWVYIADGTANRVYAPFYLIVAC